MVRSGIVQTRGDSIGLGMIAGVVLSSVPWAWAYPFPRVMLAMISGMAVALGVADALTRVGGVRLAV